MIKQVRIEIKNAMNQIEFKVLFAAILLISLISILLNCFQDYGHNILFIKSYVDNSMYNSIKARPIVSVFEYLSPLIVMMIYSSSKWKEEKNGMQSMIITRTNKREYYLSKFIANFIIVFGVILFSGLINLLISYTVYPVVGFDNRWGIPVYDLIQRYDKRALLDLLRIQNPFVYILIKNIIVSTFLATISNIPYCLSFIKPFKEMEFIQICIMTFIAIAVASIIGVILHISFINYISYMYVDARISFSSVCVSIIVLNITEVLILFKGMKKYETIHS
ncbi:hypothetical protein [uncultured Catenibacterium sp.]|uniref:hypothetical protein n=1 Tax=Catenibacterium sp. TaxID=2049022 RepID=UPI00259530A2|nr:hypothetical protein [uncultured Catenibacterium sp.]